MQIDSLVTALDLIATFAFAIVGARIAASKGLDYGGIALIAAVASVSGGTFRNLFMGQRPPWILHSWLFASVALAVLITVIAKETKPVGRFLLALDTFGLAVATVSSANFAIANNANFVSVVALGIIGGVSGGLLRDVLCQVEPVLLHRETIGTSCFAGALIYAGMNQLDISESITVIASGLVVVLVREISIKLDWHLPKI
ncbi:MAG: trimeric intracellular cation channel family protein [Candidatus Nanopelagicaceae bacterium]